MKRDDYIYVFIREFLICDVAQGLNGDPLCYVKREPPCLRVLVYKKKIKYIFLTTNLGYPIFLWILISHTLSYHKKNSLSILREFPL